jgi:hypothetical protein
MAKACVAEKTPLTNHIGRHFAGIKAPGFRVVTGRFGKKARFHNASKSADRIPERTGL